MAIIDKTPEWVWRKKRRRELLEKEEREKIKKPREVVVMGRRVKPEILVVIRVTRTNIFISVVNDKGEILRKESSGTLDLHGRTKPTEYAGRMVGTAISEYLKKECSDKSIGVKVKGVMHKKVKMLLQTVVSVAKGCRIVEVENIKGSAHNGVRKKKMRRL